MNVSSQIIDPFNFVSELFERIDLKYIEKEIINNLYITCTYPTPQFLDIIIVNDNVLKCWIFCRGGGVKFYDAGLGLFFSHQGMSYEAVYCTCLAMVCFPKSFFLFFYYKYWHSLTVVIFYFTCQHSLPIIFFSFLIEYFFFCGMIWNQIQGHMYLTEQNINALSTIQIFYSET